MKKLLALVLCIAMIASMCVFSTSAAADYAIMPGDKVLTGEGNFPLKPDKSYNVEDMTLEFDVAFAEDNEKGVCGFGIDSTNGRLTISRFGIGFVDTYKDADTIKAAVTPFGEVQSASWKNQHHIKIDNASSGVTIYVDGKEAFTSTDKIALWAGVTNLGFHAGVMGVKNLVMSTTSTGDEILRWDGSSLMNDQLGGGGGWGGVQEITTAPDFLVPSYDDYIFKPGDAIALSPLDGSNTPVVPSEDIPTRDMALEFDIAFVEDGEKGTCLIAPDVYDGNYGRLIISRFGVGIGNAYGSSDVVQSAVAAAPLPNVEAASWTNQHHVKLTSTDAGITVFVDGAKVYENSSAVITNSWIGDGATIGWMNLGCHAGRTALDNIKVSVNSTGKVIYSFDGSSDMNITSGDYGSSMTLSTVPEYLVINPVVNVINGYTQLEYSGNLADKQVYTMDLALIPDENGVAELTVWGGANGTLDRAGIKLDANTGIATVGVACDKTAADGHADHGNFTAPVTFNWGKGIYNNMHKVVFTFDGTVTINIDGADVYNSGIAVPTNGNAFAVLMGASGNPVIDNFSLVSGDVNLTNDFEENNNGIPGSIKTIYPCGDNHTFSPFFATTTAPTCTAKGVGTAICEVCGEATTTKDIPALGHDYTDRFGSTSNRVEPTATEDGRYDYACKRCGEVISTIIPATDKYTGSFSAFNDMTSIILAKNMFGIPDTNKIVDGHVSGRDFAYAQAWTAEVNPSDGYTVSLDVRLNEVFAEVGDNSQGTGEAAVHDTFHFWFGGSGGTSAYAGINFATGTAFIKAKDGASFVAKEVPVDINPGEWHTYALKFVTNWDEFTCSAQFLIDGEAVVTYDETDNEDLILIIGSDEGATSAPVIVRAFGVDLTLDNYVIGSYDFAWANAATLLGDVNGDGTINMKDLLRMKKFAAGVITETDLVLANADMDLARDGVTAADVRLLKKLIASI